MQAPQAAATAAVSAVAILTSGQHQFAPPTMSDRPMVQPRPDLSRGIHAIAPSAISGQCVFLPQNNCPNMVAAPTLCTNTWLPSIQQQQHQQRISLLLNTTGLGHASPNQLLVGDGFQLRPLAQANCQKTCNSHLYQSNNHKMLESTSTSEASTREATSESPGGNSLEWPTGASCAIGGGEWRKLDQFRQQQKQQTWPQQQRRQTSETNPEKQNRSYERAGETSICDRGQLNSMLSDEEKLKTFLNQFALASNVPFAYAIILIAFLITMIAATSIITILTVVLTLTGYTAYPITENTFNTSLAIGVVCASLALGLVTVSLLIWRRHCQAAYYYLDEPQDASRATNSPQPSETYDNSEFDSIMVIDWAKHVQRLHADSDIGFSREFEQIQQANQKNNALTCDHSQLAENKHKNRYINIVAYDHTRVALRPPLGGQKKPGYDYINANFIDVSTLYKAGTRREASERNQSADTMAAGRHYCGRLRRKNAGQNKWSQQASEGKPGSGLVCALLLLLLFRLQLVLVGRQRVRLTSSLPLACIVLVLRAAGRCWIAKTNDYAF